MDEFGLFTVLPFLLEASVLPIGKIGNGLGTDAKLDEVKRHKLSMNQIAAKSRCAKCHIPAFVAIAAEMLYLRGKGVSFPLEAPTI
jgi:hypothetical protein